MVEKILPVALNALRDKIRSCGRDHAGLACCHFLVGAGGGGSDLTPFARTTCNPISFDLQDRIVLIWNLLWGAYER